MNQRTRFALIACWMAATIAAAALMIALVHRGWLMGDDFLYLYDAHPKRMGWAEWLFAPSSGHTMLWTKLWFSGVVPAFGFDSYLPYVAPTIAFQLIASGAAAALVLKVTRCWPLAIAVALAMGFRSYGEVSLYASSVNFSAPVAMALLWLLWQELCLDRTAKWRTALAAALFALIGALGSMVFLPIAAALALGLFMKRQRLASFLMILMPVVVFIASRLLFPGMDGDLVHESTLTRLAGLPRSVWQTSASACGRFFGLDAQVGGLVVGGLIVAATLIGSAIALARLPRLRPLVATLTIAPILFLIVTSWVRVEGAGGAAPRYGFVVTHFWLALWSVLLANLALRVKAAGHPRRAGAITAVTVAALCWAATVGSWELIQYDKSRAANAREMYVVTEAAANLIAEGEPYHPQAGVAFANRTRQGWVAISARTVKLYLDRGWIRPRPTSAIAATQARIQLQVTLLPVESSAACGVDSSDVTASPGSLIRAGAATMPNISSPENPEFGQAFVNLREPGIYRVEQIGNQQETVRLWLPSTVPPTLAVCS